MELFEIEERIVKESQTYTPNVYGNIVAAAQAEGLLSASVGGAVGVAAAGSSGSGTGAAVKTTAALGLKKILLISASAIAAVAIAAGSITAAVVLNSDNGGLPDSATAENGAQEETGDNDDDETGDNDETGGNDDDDGGNNGEETKITTYVGLTYKFVSAKCPNFDRSPSASEEELFEADRLISLYNESFTSSMITFSTEDSFTLYSSYDDSTYSGTVEKSAFDEDQINLNVKDISKFYTEDDYVYILFNRRGKEIDYEGMQIMVIPEGKTTDDIVYLTFILEK